MSHTNTHTHLHAKPTAHAHTNEHTHTHARARTHAHTHTQTPRTKSWEVLHQCGVWGSVSARCCSVRRFEAKDCARESLRTSVIAVMSYISTSRPITMEN